MLNLMKMNMYRLFRSFSTYAMVIITGLLAIANIGIAISIGVFEAASTIDYSNLLYEGFQSKIILIMVSVFVTLFVAAEQKNGFIKNIAGQFPRRGILIIAKLVSVALQLFIMFLTFALFTLIFSFIYWGDKITLNSVSDLLQIVAIQYLLHFAFACLITLLYHLINSSALCMTLGILLSSTLANSLYSVIDYVLEKFTQNAFHSAEYMLSGNIALVGAGITSDMATRAIIVSLVFIFMSTGFAVLTVQKRDIR